MRTRSSKNNLKTDVNVIAKSIVDQSTGVVPVQEPPEEPKKNPHAVALGRMGGAKGGKARAAKLSKKERQTIAKKAAKARWGNS
jgi:hypothetical protein